MEATDFKGIRDYLGISQVVLADKLGRTSVMVSHYETGKESIPKIVALAMYWLEHEAQLKGNQDNER